ncbi:MAG: TIGR02757 family protein [Lentimicrobiaceae bacterium]|nr:TIGR02757 family protein [Lentimicrobiaceae bacterium]MCP4910966.1 TIGR02757 family protein [Bacteroidota bacterium]MBT3453673.1 TIGR02757 family protein [Lentimicrobiaceae bacterium]MBT3818242.1 TIGR02757 family protein [Lentimicrobiaceae bacterium]MBT4061788.1 TIGR02757 family protein [Lentimicrobiaceae bacterium]
MEGIIDLLDSKVNLYNKPSFIESDPISIPHQYTLKEDIEISGFLTAVIAWGRRSAIISKANLWMELMDGKPYDFIMNASDTDMKRFEKFVYRTFNSDDCLFIMTSLMDVYRNKGGLETIITDNFKYHGNIKDAISGMRGSLMETAHLKRSEKHIANPTSGSAAKRINMFLRWMVRDDKCGVDFGLWKNIPMSALMCPLDVHSGNVARRLGMLDRKQNDWKSVDVLTSQLRKFDPNDPVKYDFALFGMGVFEGIS